MTKSDKLWERAFKLEGQAEALKNSDQSYDASIEINKLYQEAGRLREKALKAK